MATIGVTTGAAAARTTTAPRAVGPGGGSDGGRDEGGDGRDDDSGSAEHKVSYGGGEARRRDGSVAAGNDDDRGAGGGRPPHNTSHQAGGADKAPVEELPADRPEPSTEVVSDTVEQPVSPTYGKAARVWQGRRRRGPATPQQRGADGGEGKENGSTRVADLIWKDTHHVAEPKPIIRDAGVLLAAPEASPRASRTTRAAEAPSVFLV